MNCKQENNGPDYFPHIMQHWLQVSWIEYIILKQSCCFTGLSILNKPEHFSGFNICSKSYFYHPLPLVSKEKQIYHG
jgi:hypothetical protein